MAALLISSSSLIPKIVLPLYSSLQYRELSIIERVSAAWFVIFTNLFTSRVVFVLKSFRHQMNCKFNLFSIAAVGSFQTKFKNKYATVQQWVTAMGLSLLMIEESGRDAASERRPCVVTHTLTCINTRICLKVWVCVCLTECRTRGEYQQLYFVLSLVWVC